MKISKLTALVFVLAAVLYSPKVDAQNVPNILEIGRESRSRLVRVNPLAEAYYNRGNALRESGDIKGEIEFYNKALRINPNYVEAYFNRGNALRKLGDMKRAIEDYNQALRINPNYAEAYYNRGAIRVQSEDMKGGIEDYNQALRINPNYAEAYYNRGVTRAQLKGGIEDFNEALEDFNEALRINPNYAEAYYNRAAIRYQSVGKIQKITGHIRPPICKRNDYSCLFYLIGSLFTKDNTSELKKAIANLAIADLQKAFELFLQQGKMAEYQKTLDLLKKINENKH